MIVAAALCPAAPLLIRPLNGGAAAVPELRQACLDAVADLVSRDIDVVVVAGAGDESRSWDADARLDVSFFAPGPAAPRAAGPATPGLPASLGVAQWLLTEAGYQGPLVLQSLAGDEPADRCARIGADLAGGPRSAGLLVTADGSARRTLKAPGYLDERSAGFDAEVERAVREADLDALLRIDQALAADLMAAGRPAWQALAGALAGRHIEPLIRYSGDPFGVAYLVASLAVAQ